MTTIMTTMVITWKGTAPSRPVREALAVRGITLVPPASGADGTA